MPLRNAGVSLIASATRNRPGSDEPESVSCLVNNTMTSGFPPTAFSSSKWNEVFLAHLSFVNADTNAERNALSVSQTKRRNGGLSFATATTTPVHYCDFHKQNSALNKNKQHNKRTNLATRRRGPRVGPEPEPADHSFQARLHSLFFQRFVPLLHRIPQFEFAITNTSARLVDEPKPTHHVRDHGGILLPFWGTVVAHPFDRLGDVTPTCEQPKPVFRFDIADVKDFSLHRTPHVHHCFCGSWTCHGVAKVAKVPDQQQTRRYWQRPSGVVTCWE